MMEAAQPHLRNEQLQFPMMADRHITVLNESEALTFGSFVKTGILQKILEAQKADVEASLLEAVGGVETDKSTARLLELKVELRAVRCSIETLNGLFD